MNDPKNGKKFERPYIIAFGEKEEARNGRALQECIRGAAGAAAGKNCDHIKICLHEGEYRIDEPLLFDEDTADLPIVICGEGKTVLTGGEKFIGGWEKTEKENIYRHRVEHTGFRQLYVNGKRAVRARFPKRGKELMLQWEGEKDYPANERRMGFLRSDIPDAFADGGLEGAEIFLEQAWAMSVALICGQEEREGKLLFKVNDSVSEPIWTRIYLPMVSGEQPAHLENAVFFLTEENEWAAKDGYLYYMPPVGVDINTLVFTVPRAERLVLIQGKQAKKVKNICFENITFAYTGWEKPNDGYCEIQATNYVEGTGGTKTYHPPAAAETRYAENIRFEGCTFINLGATAFNARKGTDGIYFRKTQVSDVSGTGLCFGYFDELPTDGFDPFHAKDDAENCVRNVGVEACLLTRVGADFQGGSAICAGYVRDISVCHNTIFDIAYSGVALGWGWQDPRTVMGNFNVSYNRIYNTLAGLGYDGAEIYFVGKHDESLPLSVVEGNYVTCGGGLGGVYFDEGSNGYRMQNNVLEGLGNYPARKVALFFHDANCAEKNIVVTKTYSTIASDFNEETAVGGAYALTYMMDGSPAVSTAAERGISVEKFIVKEGEWCAQAREIIENAGRR